MDTEMVMAWGDDGLELCPRSEVVEIKAFPVGEKNAVIPATVRWLAKGDKAAYPARLLGIRTKNRAWPSVTFRRGNGQRSSCNVRHARDAQDELFAHLPAHSRARIAAAVAAASVGSLA